ncbi:hypothetical protein B0H19DRAFT_1338987 [Mycena capillaripes]|nr:hypothetical protein B0H19DRAFT_1338987 [Mycena capillaripes]
MMPALRLGFLAFGILGAVQAQVAVSPSKPSPPASTTSFPKQVIGQTPNSLFLENIAVRASSELLLTSVASSTIFTFNPTTINGTFDPIYTFPNANGLTGIAEYRPGVFAVVASILDLTTRRWAPGSIVIWTIDFNMPTPTVRALAALESAEGANGITTLPGHPDTLLVADSVAGAVWQVDGRTGKSRVAIQDASMLPGAPTPALGINGLHIRDAHLYFVNSQRQIFARVPLAVKGGNITAAGVVETLAAVEPVGENPDDFALDCEGRAWVAVHPGALALFSPPASGRGNWTQVTTAGNDNGTDTGFIQPTSAAFGRGSEIQEKMLYVTTGAGQVVAVDTSG